LELISQDAAMDVVKAQYQRWIYPDPINDLEIAVQNGYYEIGEPLSCWPTYWPRQRELPKELLILSAGCGTNQAAYYAFRYPEAKVIGIDLSEEGLAHSQLLKDKHNLRNLTLHNLSILDLSSLNEHFDFIACTGVIHHMKNPVAGLQALGECLKPTGIANLMVYSYGLRTGVYMLQRAFKDLGFKQVPKDVEMIRQVLASLHAEHPVHKYINTATDLHADAGIVDTFLHPQDQAYSAGDIFNLTRAGGLEFLSWSIPHIYSLDVAVPIEHPLKARLESLDPQKEANVCDMLTQQTGTHRWYAALPTYVNSIQIPFGDELLGECFVTLNQAVVVETPANLELMTPAYCRRGELKFSVEAQVAEVLRLMGTGFKSIEEAVRVVALNSADVERLFSECDKQ